MKQYVSVVSRLVACLLLAGLLLAPTALARPIDDPSLPNSSNNTSTNNSSNSGSGSNSNQSSGVGDKKDCQNNACTDPAADPHEACSKNNCDFIKKYVNPAINLLSVLFGLIAAGSIILAGIQYSTSEGDPQKSAKAKSRIQNTIIAVVFYFFLYALLQFLIPGGIFS